MLDFKKILVAIDIYDKNLTAVGFASSLSRMAQTEEVIFFSVDDDPGTLDSCIEVSGCRESSGGLVTRTSAEVKQIWNGHPGTTLSFEASDGDQLRDILALCKKKSIDLVVVTKTCGSSKMPERLARKAPCSVLQAPPGFAPTFKNIMVALDFSTFSKPVLEAGAAIAADSGTASLKAVHAYSVPHGYGKTGITYEAFAAILRKNAEEDFKKLLAESDMKGLKAGFIVDIDDSPFKRISEIVAKEGTDLLVVGSRGRSKTAAILLGLVTERLLEFCNVPILTLKKKGQTLGFLEAMLGI